MSIAAGHLKALAPLPARGYYRFMRRVGQRLTVVVLAACFAAGLPAGAAATNAFDREIMEFVQRNRSPGMDHAMSVFSNQWSKQNLLVAGFLVTIRGDDESFRATEECAKAIAVSEAIVTPLKYATGRKRPDGSASRWNSSFPSGHAASAFAAASALGSVYPPVRLPAYIAAALVAYSRVYERRHYATDVIAGACVGIASAAFARVHLAWLQVDRTQLLERLPFSLDFGTEGRGLVRIYFSVKC